MTIKLIKKLGILAIIYPNLSLATCLNVAGLQFEAISRNHFLISRSGKNIGTVQIEGYYNAKKAKDFRFFTNEICDIGAERQIMIDGEREVIFFIQTFKN